MKKIYYNGKFITLEPEECEAIFIQDKIIKKVGSKQDVFAFQDKDTQIIDLKGKTIMPPFIDSHSHFIAVANGFLQVSLKECSNMKDIEIKLQEFMSQNKIGEHDWIMASGYDQNQLQEKEHITKDRLDKIIKHNPVVLKHTSEHAGVFNTKALEILGITSKTLAPAGGKIEQKEGELTGLLEENAFIEYIKKVPMPNEKALLNACIKAQQKYLSYGITTIQEGMLTKELIPIYQDLLESQELKVDLVAYMDMKIKESVKKIFAKHMKSYEKNMKIGGYKIFLDGSPQLKTAWLRKPYKDEKNYCGYPTMTDEQIEKAIEETKKENMQILAHCNGDKAAEQFIHAIKKQGKAMIPLRPVMIHAQLLGLDQLEEVKEYGIIPSFFVAHTYYWGDVHIENLGIERARKISPANSALKQEIPFTFHQDAPVIEPNMFETIWCAVKRKTKNGKILGEEERIPLIEAIKAVTINAAYQYFEENEKGSLNEGKLANFIIIDKNPFEVETDEIKNIQILETIKEGETLWKN